MHISKIPCATLYDKVPLEEKLKLLKEFKGKSFSINLSLEEVANEAGWMIQSFQVLVGAIDYNNATFEVIGGSQSQFHDGTTGQTRPTTVSYIVIA